MRYFASAFFFSCFVLGSVAAAASPITVVPLTNESQLVLVPETLGIVVNANDPQSVELGRQYARIRGVPASNIIQLRLPKVNYIAKHLMVRELERLRAAPAYDKLLAFALAFDKPYKVDANQSITSAISQGIATMTWKGSCNATVENPDADATAGVRLNAKPSMLLFGGGSLAESVALASRGKAADASDPPGDVFLVKTNNTARSRPREASMDRALASVGEEITVTVTKAQALTAKAGVIGFQTGLPVLKDLGTFNFLPGAFADHLTSFGGAIGENRGQTPITELIRTGATASYGTVREPCNFPEKFPDPERLLRNYLHGDSIIEAYWKSLSMTTEGLLIGEPLARPFPVVSADLSGTTLTFKVNRHTQSFLLDAKGSLQDGVSTQGMPENIPVGIYDVTAGHPVLLGDFTIQATMKDGALIGRLELSKAPKADLILGMRPRR